MQRFGRYTPFVRWGYADGGANGPTAVEYMANAGLVIDGIFGQVNDRIGIGYTWANPATNAAASKRILRGWATTLRDALDESRQ